MRKVVNTPLEIAEDLRRIAAEHQDVVLTALLRAVDNPIMSESVVEVPVRTGDLRRSGTNQEDGGPPDIIKEQGRTGVVFGYGKDYGFWVHEILTYYHKPPTKAKFLEDPVARHVDDVLDYVTKDLDMLMGAS